MATLQIDYDVLRREIGRFANSGRSASDWDSTQETDIEDALQKGLRRFYWPELEIPNPNGPADKEVYHWSFLQERFPLNLVAGAYRYDLPQSFNRMAEDFVYSDGSKQFPLERVSDRQLRSLRSTENKQGPPRYYAISSRVAMPGKYQQHEVSFYPTPLAAAEVTGILEIDPPATSSTEPYVLGGAMHAETVLESCLAAAELIFFPETGPGIHAQQFERCLRRSIEADRELTGESGMVWPDDPLDAGVSNLSVNKFYLMRVIGKFMGIGAHPDAWSHDRNSQVLEVLRTGMRDFYNPQVLPGERDNHQWSFLTPTYRLALVSGKYTYDMPDTFSAINGDIRYAPNTGQCYPDIEVSSIDHVLNILEYSTDSYFAPTSAAFRVKEPDETAGTKWELVLAPAPPGGVEILIPFSVNPYQLDKSIELPLGGQPHSQTLIESCLAAAEIEMGGQSNIHQNKFLVKLQASISHDRQATCPRTVGVSHDDSDNTFSQVYWGSDYWEDNHTTTYDLS